MSTDTIDRALLRQVRDYDTDEIEACINDDPSWPQSPRIQDGQALARELRNLAALLANQDWTLLKMQGMDYHHIAIEAANALEEFGA